MSENPNDSYEAPEVDEVDAEDTPATTAAGGTSDGGPG